LYGGYIVAAENDTNALDYGTSLNSDEQKIQLVQNQVDDLKQLIGQGQTSAALYRWHYATNGADALVFDNKSGVSTLTMTDSGLLFENNTREEWAFVRTKESYALASVEMRVSFRVKSLPDYINVGYSGMLILDDPHPNVIFTAEGVYTADPERAAKVSDYVLAADVDHVLCIRQNHVYVDDTLICDFAANVPYQPVCIGGSCAVYIKSIEVLSVG